MIIVFVIFLAFIILLPILQKKEKQWKSTMSDKKEKNVNLFVSLLVFGLFLGFIILVANYDIVTRIFNRFGVTSESESKVADGFTIEGYEVILNVGLDNKVEVTENIDINFYEKGHHGIYKFTPYWLEYTGKDGKTINRKSNIINLRSEGDEFTIDTVNKKERIKIGSPSIMVDGDHKYTIKYTYDMGKDPFKGFDEFIFHVFGDFWGTEIKNPKIVINLPKGIENNEINFYTDKYRKQNINNLVDYSVSGNSITIVGKGDLHLNKSLTVDIAFPENYFVGGSFNYGFISFILCMIVLGITGYIIYMWSRFGKNYQKRIPTVEFYAPDDLNSAEIGYIYNKRRVSRKLTISLIVQLASKGYIKIDEIKGKSKRDTKIQITNLLIEPRKISKDDLKIPRRVITVKKLKEADDLLNQSELTMMTHMFKEDSIKAMDANIDKFLEVKDHLLSGGYIEIINDNGNDINSKYQNELKEYEKLNTSYEENIKKYNELKSSLKEIHGMESAIYHRLFESKDVIILSEHTTFYHSFNEVSNDLDSRFKKKVYDEESKRKKNKSRILNFISIILSIVSFYVIEDMDPSWSIVYYVSFACFFVNIFFTIIMGRKTDYGEIISARVKGFREFLTTAEKEKLESLVEQNPHYFYDILPYTYVLGISKKWIEKFENIKMPEVNMGDFDYNSGDSLFSDIGSNIYYPAPVSSSSSSGCSSCGGGCSSCGGGCSSCGGGGSW